MIQEAELDTLSQKKETTEKQFPYPVRIHWNNQSVPWWNECCATVLEVFGLPGDRFVYHPFEDYMEFHFSSIKDQQLCQIMFSEIL